MPLESATLARQRPAADRCPACGHQLPQPKPGRCPLCRFSLGVDERTTAADFTPYAQATHEGRSGWRSMCEWIWFARTERLKHLALTRASSPSRRFAWINILILSFALGFIQLGRIGWRHVTDSPAIEPTGFTKPAGQGWLHVATASRPLPPGQPPEIHVDLWWNIAQSAIGLVSGLLAGMLLAWLALFIGRLVITLAHKKAFRGEQRMTAALHYSSAFMVPLLPAAFLLGITPIAYLGRIWRFPWHPPEKALQLFAGTIAAFAIVTWWFWLIRLASTAPADTRGRMTAALAIGPPLLGLALSAAWVIGLNAFYSFLFPALSIQF